MGKGLERNRPCWCGSGKKYKNCHLNRVEKDPINPWDAERMIRKVFSAKYCLAPESWHNQCARQIVQAHTIPKSGSLAKIAREGKVYSYSSAISFASLNHNQGLLVPKLIGLNKASTFTGFCATHDNAIFAPLEKQNFVYSAEQCFLLAYRAFSREMFTKRAQLKTIDIGRDADQGKSIDTQLFVQSLSDNMQKGAEAALRDQEHIRPIFERILVNSDFGEVRAYVIEFKTSPPVMCSGCFCPDQDFEGRELQDLSDCTAVPSILSMNSFFGGNSGFVVFAWISRDEPICRNFIETLDAVPDNLLFGALLRIMFEYIENLCIEPDWWESLTTSQQARLNERMTYSAVPWNPRKPNCLADDMLGIHSWQVISRRWVGATSTL